MDAPSKLGTAGPHRGHIRATNDRITADNHGQHRPLIRPAHRAHSPIAAGHRDRPAVPDTEEDGGSTPPASTTPA